MDSYREHPSDFELPASEASAAEDVSIAIGTDERRMHVRAYNYWVSLLDGRDYPSIEDLEPGDVADFAANSVLLDFTCGRDNPATPYIGAAIREECGLGDEIRTINDVPSRSLLSRLTDHYLQIIANRAPIGFEAEFVNQRGEPICYRGILMPFSSDGDTIDFIYGVINWKQSAELPQESPTVDSVVTVAAEPDQPEERTAPEPNYASLSLPPRTDLADASGNAESLEELAPRAPAFEQPFHRPVSLDPIPDQFEEDVQVPELDEDAGLADRLWAAREIAEAVKSADGRSRVALYRALSLAYDFAVAADSNPDDYRELLEESGMKAQARAPMTPIVKLVFGIDYDKTRLTEFASALSFAQRQQVALGGFQSFIEGQPGGLKALVAAERQAKRPQPREDTKLEEGRRRLRSTAPIVLADIASTGEFALVITRRNADGVHEAVALIEDEAMIERAIRRAG